MAMVANRFDVFLINPAVGSEIQKTRPCVIISPDEMNRHIRTVIVAPLTTAGKEYPTRIPCEFKKKKGHIVLDRIRTIDKTRLIKNLGTLDAETQSKVISVLQRLFAF
jgi:mRNA interferase MazF